MSAPAAAGPGEKRPARRSIQQSQGEQMSEVKTENAEIMSTMLGTEDHGIMTCYLHLKYDGGGQGFGGLSFDSPVLGEDGRFKRRMGNSFGLEFIARVLRTVGVDKWEALPGKFVRARHTHTKVLSIGHIIEDKWFSPDTLVSEMGIGEDKS